MTTKEKIMNQLPAILTVRRVGLELVMALLVSLSVSAPAFAVQAGGSGSGNTGNGGAKCAILDQGRVTCPPTISGGGCWYKDLGRPSAGPNQDGWIQAPDCSNGIFQEAAQPQVNTYQDPALVPCNAPSVHAAGETAHCNLVKKYIDPLINVLAASVGVAVTISIVVGGIQYASSAGDPGKMQAAKKRIINALIALVGFFLLYAVLQWLVPGGLLNG